MTEIFEQNTSVSSSLWDLLNKNDNKPELIKNISEIKIPKIQRDYAQGRDDKDCSDKRKSFLNYLLNRIKAKTPTYLDFVYGSVENNTMFPLDGQQRLTTLFLLHIYAYKLLKRKDKNIEKVLSNFTYDTRETAKKFCQNIVENDWEIPDYTEDKIRKYKEYYNVSSPYEFFKINEDFAKDNKLDSANEYALKPVSAVIKNQIWYFSEYEYDQTIKAMLNTLEDIHNIFNGKIDNLWKQLTEWKTDEDNRELGKIRFYYLSLDNFNLSEDLYIKMNARGKMLTNFENLRAEIIELIKIQEDYENNSDEDTERMKPFIEDNLKDEVSDFAIKSDVEWSELLWKYKNKYSLTENYFIDYAYMKLFANCIIYNSDDKTLIQNLNNEEQRNNLLEYLLYTKFEGENPDKQSIDKVRSQKIFSEFCEILNLYTELESDEIDFQQICPDINFWHFNSNKNKIWFKEIFYKTKLIEEKGQEIIVPDNAEIISRVLFFARTQYLLKAKDIIKDDNWINSKQYRNWLRIIRNLVEIQDHPKRSASKGVQSSPWLRNIPQIITIIKLIRNLSECLTQYDNYDIYKYLAKADIEDVLLNDIDNVYYKNQIKEECAKAKIICSDETKAKIIFSVEDNNLSRGSIRFALECLGYNLEEKWDLSAFNKWEDLESLNNNVLSVYFNENRLPKGFRNAILAIPNDENKYFSYNYRESSENNLPVYLFYMNFADIIGMAHCGASIDGSAHSYLINLIKKLFEGKSFVDIANEGKNNSNIEKWQKQLINVWEDDIYEPKIFFKKDNNQYTYFIKKPKEDKLINLNEINMFTNN